MKIKAFDKLDINLYSEVLSNGLEVYIVPINKNNNIYATFSSKFGSRISEFEVDGKMIKVPLGIAHFLEHKAFEQQDGTDPFTYFSERGANANANTNYDKTTYLFSGTDFFEDNMNYLLDYVQSPYFTEENTEKEKGIIVQEYEMYQDKPFTRLYEGLLKNSFINDAVKYPIIGTVKSINSITKEQLYNCYNTFYHPSNMFVVVTGNVVPEKVIEIIKKNQDKKIFEDNKEIKIKKFKEPEKVEKKYEEIQMDITISKVLIGYKLNISKLKKLYNEKYMDYIVLLFDILFGSSSKINEELHDKKIIYGDIMIDYVEAGDYCLFMVGCETDKKDEFIEKVTNVTNNIFVTKDELERKKKVLIGSRIALSDDIFSINDKIMANIIKYSYPICNAYEIITSLNIDEMNRIIRELSFENKSIFVINPK